MMTHFLLEGMTAMVQERYLVTEDYKVASTEILVENLPSLRARIGITQEELANIIGISRQTYYSLETGKREMSWPIFLAIVFIFDSVKETSEMIRDLRIFPIDLIMQFNGE
ncbi:MAG: helix-turn-helix domain-containing protein, partial [Paludibacteraceae bacterium]|nr:helix-turn-helix domain-containing protein [Paludibacteraceae bacterium]